MFCLHQFVSVNEGNELINFNAIAVQNYFHLKPVLRMYKLFKLLKLAYDSPIERLCQLCFTTIMLRSNATRSDTHGIPENQVCIK
jgi:hypothetical protein